MKTIYIDVLFAVNFIINYIILLTSAKFGGFIAKRKRIFLAALLGALYAAVMFFPTISFIYTFWIKALFAVVISGVAYGFHNFQNLIRKTIIVFVVSFAYGGGIIALSNIFSANITVSNGIPYINLSLKTLIISCLICYVVIGVVFKSYAKKGEKCIKNITVCMNKNEIKLNTLVDTGCELCDPISGKPVIVCEKQAITDLIGGNIADELNKASENSSVELFQKIINYNGGERFRLVPFKTVGNMKKMMLSFRPDEVITEKGKKIHALIGISDVKFSAGCGYSALMGTKCQ